MIINMKYTLNSKFKRFFFSNTKHVLIFQYFQTKDNSSTGNLMLQDKNGNLNIKWLKKLGGKQKT